MIGFLMQAVILFVMIVGLGAVLEKLTRRRRRSWRRRFLPPPPASVLPWMGKDSEADHQEAAQLELSIDRLVLGPPFHLTSCMCSRPSRSLARLRLAASSPGPAGLPLNASIISRSIAMLRSSLLFDMAASWQLKPVVIINAPRGPSSAIIVTFPSIMSSMKMWSVFLGIFHVLD